VLSGWVGCGFWAQSFSGKGKSLAAGYLVEPRYRNSLEQRRQTVLEAATHSHHRSGFTGIGARICGRPDSHLCVSLRGRPPGLQEVLLDKADGLDWETAVRCDLIQLLERRRFLERRGHVIPERQIQIGRKLI
jgi:hypothetical protein